MRIENEFKNGKIEVTQLLLYIYRVFAIYCSLLLYTFDMKDAFIHIGRCLFLLVIIIFY